MKIYTKRGDKGETDLFGGDRVKKSHVRIRAFGEIDYLNSALGFACSAPEISHELKADVVQIMELLFCMGAEVATSDKESAQNLLSRNLDTRVLAHHVSWLEAKIDAYESRLEPLKSFILPLGSELTCRLHLARNVARGAEVALVELMDSGAPVREDLLQFSNRLSDFLFVLARVASLEAQVPEHLWSGKVRVW